MSAGTLRKKDRRGLGLDVAAGGVVGVADDEKARALPHRRQHGLEIVVERRQRLGRERSSVGERDRPVHHEGGMREDDVVLGAEEGLPQKHEQLAGAVAEDQAFLGNVETLGQETP